MIERNHRTSEHPIDPVFLDRWSPRAFTGEALKLPDLMTMIEAARWAPSSYNSQPWRFIYGLKGDADFQTLFSLLNPFNQSWCEKAGALLVLVSSKTMTPPGADGPRPSHSHSADAGAAWGYLALQAAKLGWQAHGMVGFDIEGAAKTLGVPEGFRVEMAIAIGRPGDKSLLPEALAAREEPSARKPLAEIAFPGRFEEAR